MVTVRIHHPLKEKKTNLAYTTSNLMRLKYMIVPKYLKRDQNEQATIHIQCTYVIFTTENEMIIYEVADEVIFVFQSTFN